MVNWHISSHHLDKDNSLIRKQGKGRELRGEEWKEVSGRPGKRREKREEKEELRSLVPGAHLKFSPEMTIFSLKIFFSSQYKCLKWAPLNFTPHISSLYFGPLNFVFFRKNFIFPKIKSETFIYFFTFCYVQKVSYFLTLLRWRPQSLSETFTE